MRSQLWRGRAYAIGLLSMTIGFGAVAVPDVVQAAVPPVVEGSSAVVTADALPTAQIDGVVWTQQVVGDTVFAGGDFATARPAGAAPGVATVTRTDLVAFNLKTGRLTSFAPTLNGEVRALAVSTNRKTLYVGGAFTTVNGTSRSRFAAFDVSSGQLTALAPTFNSRVNAITTTAKSIYVGGWFTSVDGTSRQRLAALTAHGTLRAWSPTADDTVSALVVTPDKSRIVIGGSFSSLSGKSARGMGSVGATSGRVKTWSVNKVIKDYGPSSGITSLAADGDTVYGSAYGVSKGNFEGVFAARPKDGKIRWLQDCHGDQYGVVPVGSTVYSVGHAHYCSNIGGFGETLPQRALAVSKKAGGTIAKNGQTNNPNYTNFAGRPGPSLKTWFPTLTAGTYTGLTQAAWSIVAGSGYVVLGGEFTDVNGVPQQGLVRFTVPSKAPDKQGPQVTGDGTAPVVTSTTNGPQLTWRSNFDRDDQKLYYAIYRDGVKVTTLKARSQFWLRPNLTFVDRDASAGAHYRIRIRDADLNLVWSPTVTLE